MSTLTVPEQGGSRIPASVVSGLFIVHWHCLIICNISNKLQKERNTSNIMTDLNLDLLKPETSEPTLLSLFYSYFHTNTIINPTRVTQSAATRIDLSWSNNFSNSRLNVIECSRTLYHFPIFPCCHSNYSRLDGNTVIPKT